MYTFLVELLLPYFICIIIMTELFTRNNVIRSNNGVRNVAYIFGPAFLNKIEHMPKFGKRAVIVHNLIKAYGLLDNMTVIAPEPATEEQLKDFHSEDFVNYIKCSSEENECEYGIGYDCPVFEKLFETVSAGVGATLSAARALTSKEFTVAINWAGGWHHAKRDEASGFCYLNDIVLGILHLRRAFDKVLYVDLDLHHGDGVEDAFSYSSKVFCFSVHKFAPGFFPCSGSFNDVGRGKGKFHTMNVPLQDGIRDGPFTQTVLRLLNEIKVVFKPDAVVLQSGTDTLFGDPFNIFNLTSAALGHCLEGILTWRLPLLVLGGGGYNSANTARCWTYLTSILCGVELCDDIPAHEHFLYYGPGYELGISPGNRPDLNTPEYLNSLTTKLLSHLQNIS